MIDYATSYRLLKYIYFIATAPVPWHYVAPFYHRHLAYNQFYISTILQALLKVAYLQITLFYTSKEPIIVRQYFLLAIILNLENNPIPILDLYRQLTLRECNLSALALTPKRKPSGLKNYNNFNKVNTNNILFFINYITTDKQVKGLPPIKIKIWDAEMFAKMVAQEPSKYYCFL